MSARPPILVGPLPPPVHGLAAAFGAFVDDVRRRGHAVELVDLFPDKRPDAVVAGGRSRLVALLPLLLPYWRRLLGRRRTVYVAIAQSRGGFLRDCAFLWPAALLGHRLVVHLHGGNYGAFHAAQPRWLQALIAATLRRCDAIIVLGAGLRAMFDFDPALAARIAVVPNGLEPPPPAPRPPRAAGRLRVLYLSNLIESKGWIEVLEAVARLRTDHGIDATVAFAGRFLANPSDDVRVTGEAQARALYDDLVARLGLTGHATWHGVVQGETKARLLAEADAFVLPTSYDAEGQPLSILEAMAAGAVVVATDYRAIPDMIIHDETGLLIPQRDAAPLTEALLRLARDPALGDALAARARARQAERFTLARHVDALWSHVGAGDA